MHSAAHLTAKTFLEADPHSAAPVPAALVLAPAIMLSFTPPPIIGMDVQSKFGPVIRMASHVPTVAFVIAYDSGRGRGERVPQ